jgi:3-oxoacyl-(acyl-carrier-protein) synthase
LICAHGNGNQASDRTEAMGIQRVFGDRTPPVTAFKWCYGHLIAASGIADIVMTLKALHQKSAPGIATLAAVDPLIGSFPISAKPQAPTSDVALVICRGFGGMNVVVAVRARREP